MKNVTTTRISGTINFRTEQELKDTIECLQYDIFGNVVEITRIEHNIAHFTVSVTGAIAYEMWRKNDYDNLNI